LRRELTAFARSHEPRCSRQRNIPSPLRWEQC
jgi:hypothetical protein